MKELAIARRIAVLRPLAGEVASELGRRPDGSKVSEDLAGTSPVVLEVYGVIDQVAVTDATVLKVGAR